MSGKLPLAGLYLKVCLALVALQCGSMAALAQNRSVGVPMPPIRPGVDQLGQMMGVAMNDRTVLVATLFLQVIACVFVAVAFGGHLSLPKKKN